MANPVDKQKIRQRYKGISLDEIEKIPAIEEKDIFEDDSDKRVGVYARVSTDDPRQTSSFELQRNHYTDLIDRRPGWHLYRIYADEGISGTSLKHRDAFLEMIEDCKQHKIDLIVTKSVHRLVPVSVDGSIGGVASLSLDHAVGQRQGRNGQRLGLDFLGVLVGLAFNTGTGRSAVVHDVADVLLVTVKLKQQSKSGQLYLGVLNQDTVIIQNFLQTVSAEGFGNHGQFQVTLIAHVVIDDVVGNADYEITYFPDIPVNYDENFEIIPDENGKFVIENEATHYFFINADHVYDAWFYNNRLSIDMQIELLQSVNIQLATSAEISEWNVSIKPDRVSRTGATALFVYNGSIPGEEGAELTYGDFLSLDRLVDGNWVPCDELAGYEHFVGDASYPVVDGYGMVHEWPNRFGELADGHYRIGKQVTLVRQDGSTESRMVYGEFTLPDSVRTGLIPLNELPEVYSGEQAMIDGCFVTADGVARENKELFQEFVVSSWNGMPGVIRTVNWHYGEDSHWSVYDLSFDGNMYTLTTLENTYTFRYLKQFTGEKAWEGADHDAFDYYVLVNDNTVTFEDIMTGKLDMSDSQNPAHWTVYANFIYAPKRPQLPANPAQAVLEFNGVQLVSITDFDRLEKIWILFSDAEFLGYEPKTHSIGVGLNLTLTSQSGETMTIELDPDSDICRINGEYVFYGAYDEPDYIEKLWYYLGFPSWPDSVYEKYPNAYRQ